MFKMSGAQVKLPSMALDRRISSFIYGWLRIQSHMHRIKVRLCQAKQVSRRKLYVHRYELCSNE